MTVTAIFHGGGYFWASDGTPGGTQAILAASGQSNANFATFGNQVVFDTATSTGSYIYITDGTAAGTRLLASFAPLVYPIQSQAIIGSMDLITTANGELLVTDGTTAGTHVVTFPTGLGPAVTSPMYSLGNVAIFAAAGIGANDASGNELWVSNGTAAGTAPLTVAGANPVGLNPTSITVFGQKAVFVGDDSSGSRGGGLWITDGTSAGTLEFSVPTLLGFTAHGMVVLGSKLLFSAADTNGNTGLWVTDGTNAGTMELPVTLPNAGASSPNLSLGPDLLITLGNKAVFLGHDASNNLGLWVTDGTAAGTTELSTPNMVLSNAPYTVNPSDFIVLGDKLLFQATDSAGKVGLWVTDGTSAGTLEITPTTVYAPGFFVLNDPPNFVRAGNGVVFQGLDVNGNPTLWFTDGTATGTRELSVTSGTTTVSPAPSGGATIGLPAAACFAAGTRLATPRGPVAIERLRAGDEVLCADGSRAPVIWRGHRRVDCQRHPRPLDVWPVRVRENAFGPGVPARDVLLSPDHAVFAGGVLVPVRYLVNGRTIAPEARRQITYWHIELPRHGVVLAEGLPCESYLDTGNRGAFVEGGDVAHLHPDFALRVWAAQGCAELVLDGERLTALRQRLLDRAAALGHARTDDPDLRVIAAGQVLRPERAGNRYRARLPAGTRGVRIVSRGAVPADMRADATDHRRLGVAVHHFVHNGTEIARDDARLGAGWHDPEPHLRWTDGDARLAVNGGGWLEIVLAMTECYWADEAATARRRVG